MSARLRRIGLVTVTLLRQNRLLLILLLLWPAAMLGVLFAVEQSTLAAEDVAAVLSQELYAGLVLVGLGASVALGNEEKARRVTQVLGRAVSRGEYLAALWASAFLPFVAYCTVWLAGWVVCAALVRPALPLAAIGAEMVAGFLLSTIALLLSVVLPQVGASIGTGIALAAGVYAGSISSSGVAGVFAALTGRLATLTATGLGESITAGVMAAAAAVWLVQRRDLRLS